jgi:hypothetical protein
MKALKKKINMIDVNMDLHELFKSTFGKPIIDVNETLGENNGSFLQRKRTAIIVRK